jgi:hypothetical protein
LKKGAYFWKSRNICKNNFVVDLRVLVFSWRKGVWSTTRGTTL